MATCESEIEFQEWQVYRLILDFFLGDCVFLLVFEKPMYTKFYLSSYRVSVSA